MFRDQFDQDDNEVKIKSTSIRLDIDYDNSLVLEFPSVKELLKVNIVSKPSFSSRLMAEKIDDNNRCRYMVEFEKLLHRQETNNGSAVYYKFLSDVACEINDRESSLKFIDKAVELSSSEYLQNEYGDRLLDFGLKDKAQAHFNNLDHKSDPHALLRLAQFYFMEGNLELAEKKVREGYSISPNDFRVRSFLGAINLFKNEYELAVRNFRVALDERPNSSSSYASLAVAYLRLKQEDKAMQAIKKSVLLNPYNENAIQIFADLAYLLHKDMDAVPILERYLDFNQTSANMWALIARAYYKLGTQIGKKSFFQKSMNALKLQSTLSSDLERPSVYNNLGLVAWKLGDLGRAQKYLNFSLEKHIDTSLEYTDTLYNVQNLLLSQEKYDLVSKISDEYFEYSNGEIPDKLLLQRVNILERVKRRLDAANLAFEHWEKVEDKEVKLELLSRVVYFRSTYSPNIEIIKSIESSILSLAKDSEVSKSTRTMAINNLVFAYLNLNHKRDLQNLLGLLSSSIRVDPYSTATLGMLHLKNNKVDQGSDLYKAAISLLHDRKIKAQFKQRFNFELGNAVLRMGDIEKGVRVLRKAIDHKNGLNYLNKLTESKLKSIAA